MTVVEKIGEARQILEALGFPNAQTNDRSALCLLALLNLTPEKAWRDAESRLIGITPIMDFVREHYGKAYKPNTRETFRRQTMHQFVEAGFVLYNADAPDRAVNSPKAVYRIEELALELVRTFGEPEWSARLQAYLETKPSLASRYARQREMQRIRVTFDQKTEITLSPGPHSDLIKAVIQEFASRFVPDSRLVYVGDTGEKWGYFDKPLLEECGVIVDSHGKMPDAIFYYPEKEWLLLVEAVTSHGPVDSKRRIELAELFQHSKSGLVFVTAFPTRAIMRRYLGDIAWETEVWVAENPAHLIHFNGIRFLGPYAD